MTTSQHLLRLVLRAAVALLWRGGRRAARMLRDLHNEQVYAWDCILQVGQVPLLEPDALMWTRTLDGYRLTGSYLPLS